MKLEPIEVKVDATGLDEAQKRISDFVNHPDVNRLGWIMNDIPSTFHELSAIVEKDGFCWARNPQTTETPLGDRGKIKHDISQTIDPSRDLPAIEKSARISYNEGFPCLTLYGLTLKEIYKILDYWGLNNGS